MRLAIAILVILGAAVLLTRQAAVRSSSQEPASATESQKGAMIQDRQLRFEDNGKPQSEFERLIRQDAGADRANAMIRVAATWAKENPQLAVESFLAQTSGSERARGAAQALGIWAKADPAAAKAWLEKNDLDSSVAPLLRSKLYSSWAENDPQAAITEAIRSGSGTEINTIFGIWGAQDLEGAVAFHEQLSPELQKPSRATLLLTAAAQKSEWADALFEEFLLENSETTELIRVGKALRATHPEFATLVGERLPAGPDADNYRRKIALVTGDFNVQEAGIQNAAKPIIRAPDSEPANYLPR